MFIWDLSVVSMYRTSASGGFFFPFLVLFEEKLISFELTVQIITWKGPKLEVRNFFPYK